MNTFKTIDTDYLRSDRSIETILIKNGQNEKVVWVYNFEGVFFRVFANFSELLNFFSNSSESKIYFENENELDQYFSKIQF